MPVIDNLKAGIQQAEDAWCDDCHGYAHTTDCPAYKVNKEKNPSGPVHGSKVTDKPLTAEEKMFRDAILDVINDGNSNAGAIQGRWSFDTEGQRTATDNGLRLTEMQRESLADLTRLDFADQVVLRARQIKRFDGDEEIRRRR